MTQFKNKNILITGGAGVLGGLFAKHAIERGAQKVVLWDVDEKGLENKQKELPAVLTKKVDLSDRSEIENSASELLKQLGSVDIIFNNAGIVAGKPFEDCSQDEIEKVIQVNVLAVMHVTRVFLPEMVKNKIGHIINISSAASLIANPRMSVYAGSKWAVTGWSESLRIELEKMKKGVRVTTVQPGYIDTGMFEGVKAPFMTPILKPEKIALKIIRAVEKNKVTIRSPFMVKLTPFLKGVLPQRTFDFVAGKIFGVYSTMDSFTGRK
jgi:short-subunit dehydrogenase